VFVLYNGFGQAIDTFQSHSGAVNLSTTPSVQMAYADGSANTIRPTGITYPDGRKILFGYGAADSIHDQCSLVASLIDSDTGETHLADYQYLGLGAVVLQDSPQADLRYTLVSLTGSNDPDTGDIYAGLDRFGRVKDLRWRNTDTGSDLSRVLYGYDRASSRIWRENPSDSSRRYDWLYVYDGLHRLHSAERGELSSGHTSITTPQFGQCWTLDPTGNWHGFRQDDDGNSTWDLIQARVSNPVNEITDIDNSTGSSWATPSYDANGNMTMIPRPDLGTDKAMTATWDAWNRLAKLVDPDTSDTLAEFAYDGRNFRVVGKSFTGGTLDETRHFFFTDSWQCLEERIDSSTDPERQHVWGIRYIDDLVLRDRDTTGNGTLDERYTYTSREWESEVGLYYFRNRWYAPTLGVFCSRDPSGYEDQDPNLARYVDNNPTNFTDPTGLQGWGGRVEYINEYPYYRPLPQVPPSGLQVVDCSVYEYWCKALLLFEVSN
jgi:RHS repeat-associated protein